ncbi:MAG: hypothetical protein QG646_2931 [Euryarchaeota archaeon]|nr:hypothetical protein [Euryarchaeota archaeon]
MGENLRKSGIDIVGNVPWGTHFCQFYQTKEDLMDILAPYFEAGLINNEICIWITSQPSEAEEAKVAMRRIVPDFDVYLEQGQIEIFPYTHWYFKDSVFDSEGILNGWVEKLNQALANGYDGLRLSGNTFWLKKEDWKEFADYEENLDNIIDNSHIMALCTYSLDSCNKIEIIKIIFNHQFALIKRDGRWEQMESSKSKKSEDKIQMLANVVESSDDAIMTESLDGIITSWNKGAEQVYGYSSKEVEGVPISILEPSILVEETEELTELIKQGDKIHNYETLQLRKDGKIINVSLTLSPVFNASEKLIAISIIARDITKSKKVEEELLKNENRYRTVTEQTGQVVYDYDSRTDTGSWAGALEEVTGYSFEEFKNFGKDFWVKNIYHTDTNNQVDERFQNVRITGGRFKEELRLRKKDGTCIYIENNGICLKDHEGQPYGAIGVLKDITEKNIVEKMLHEKQIAEIANHTKSSFLANMSHELRTPLNSIIGFSDMLFEQAYGELNEKQLRSVGNISKSGKHLLNLINSILDISKIEAGKIDIRYKNFELATMLNTIRNVLFPVADKKNIKIEIDMDSKYVSICADEDKFVQIMYNLVDNAIKFSYENSFVKIGAKKKGDMVEITVKDTGIGIKVEDQDKLFKPFSQVDFFPSRKSQGTGLGLSLVKQIVHLHGGYVWFRSNPGEGSLFAFVIPINNNKGNSGYVEIHNN